MDESLQFTPDPLAKQRALEDFAHYVNPQKVRVMGRRAWTSSKRNGWPVGVGPGRRRYLDCFTSAGSFNVGRRDPASWPRPTRPSRAWTRQLPVLFAPKGRARQSSPNSRRATLVHHVRYWRRGGQRLRHQARSGCNASPKIISTVNGYHGHTGFRLSAAGRAAFRTPFEPLMPEFVQVPFGDLKQ